MTPMNWGSEYRRRSKFDGEDFSLLEVLGKLLLGYPVGETELEIWEVWSVAQEKCLFFRNNFVVKDLSVYLDLVLDDIP